VKASDLMRQLSDRTGKVWGVNAAKQLTMAAPGGSSAPVSFTDATPNNQDIGWTDNENTPANTVILACGPTGTAIHTQKWTANGVATSWVADIPAAGPGGHWTVNVGGAYEGTVGVGAMFSWDWKTRTLTSNIGAPTNGTVLTFPYMAQFPFIVRATSGASPEIQSLMAAPDVVSPAAGQELANGVLAQLNQESVEITAKTKDRGAGVWRVGQALTVNLTGRGLNGTFNVIEVGLELASDSYWVWTIRATSSSTYTGNYLDDWREIKTGSGSAPVISATAAPSTVNAIPALSVPLGGSISEYRMSDGAGTTWFDVSNGVEPFIVGEYYGAKSPQVRCTIWGYSGAVNIEVRLYNVTDGTVAGSTSGSHATPTEKTFSVTLANGRKRYKLQFRPAANYAGFCANAIVETAA